MKWGNVLRDAGVFGIRYINIKKQASYRLFFYVTGCTEKNPGIAGRWLTAICKAVDRKNGETDWWFAAKRGIVTPLFLDLDKKIRGAYLIKKY